MDQDSKKTNNNVISSLEYGQLLEQVDCLKLENSSLKRELQNNSNHISKLETEAGNLKQMVYRLASISISKPITGMHVNGLDLSSLGVSRNNKVHDLPTSIFGTNSPSGTSAVAQKIEREIMKLRLRRDDVMDALKSEEIKKECYMTQLGKLQHRLEGFSPTDKFTKLEENDRKIIEAEIHKMQIKMNEDMGTKDIMEQRVQSWLNEIYAIDREIESLKQMMDTQKSVHNSLQNSSMDESFCMAYDKPHNSRSRDVCLQTARCHMSLDHVPIKEDTPVINKNKISRSSQTILACTTYPKHKRISDDSKYSIDVPFNSSFPGASTESISSGHTEIDDTASMQSFTTSLPRNYSDAVPKVDLIYSLLSMLGVSEQDEGSRCTALPNFTPDDAFTMRQAGCIPVLVQVIHDGFMLKNIHSILKNVEQRGNIFNDKNLLKAIRISLDRRKRASQILTNIVQLNQEVEVKNSESLILMHFQKIRIYCEKLHELWLHAVSINLTNKPVMELKAATAKVTVKSPVDGTKSIKECWTENASYDFVSGLITFYSPPVSNVRCIAESAKNLFIQSVINELGGLFCHAELLVLHHRCSSLVDTIKAYVSWDEKKTDEKFLDQSEILMRSVGFTLMSLSYKNTANKAALINMPGLLETIAEYLETLSEDMQQIMTNFLRNLSWQADEQCRKVLLLSGITTVLMKCVLRVKKEETLKSFLSALWNLSGHCPQNREDICAVEGALAFLVSTLTYKNASKSSGVVEGGGGILRNVSSVIATNEKYRQILRNNDCLQILLRQLSSSSLTIVNNACGTLWNLSARDPKDQKKLRELGAEKLLKNLVNSKHQLISQGSRAALRNLQSVNTPPTTSNKNDKKDMPSLEVRKRKNMSVQKNIPVTDENFSPNHHAWSATNGSNQHKSQLVPQRHSLQETSADNGHVKNLHSSGRVGYSGSVGSIPSNYDDNYSMQNQINIRNTSKSSSHYQDFLKFSTDKQQLQFNRSYEQERFSDCFSAQSSYLKFQNIMQKNHGHKSPFLRSGYSMQTNNNNSTSQFTSNVPENIKFSPSSLQPHRKEPFTASYGGDSGNIPQSVHFDHRHTSSLDSGWKTSWSHSLSKKSPNPSASACLGAHSLGSNLTPGKTANFTAIFKNGKSPEEALRNLQNKEDNYVSDDGPVDYSLKFTDENINSEAQEEAKDLGAKNYGNETEQAKVSKQQSKLVNGLHPSSNPSNNQARSEGGFSSLSSCNGSGNSVPNRNATIALTQSVQNQQTIARRMMNASALNDLDFDDDKPTNFSERYAEKSVYESYKPMSYNVLNTGDTTNVSNLNNVKVNNTKGSLTDKNVQGQADIKEDDKFDIKPGTITPGSYYPKSGRKSGIMTPKTPNYINTPLVYSRSSSTDSLASFDDNSIHSCVTSDPGSHMISGRASPSQLPDSPSQSMPISPRHSPKNRSMNNLNQNDGISQSTEKQQVATANGNEKSSTDVNKMDNEQISSEHNQSIVPPNPAYVPILPQNDEAKPFTYEGSISGATTFSALTIDTDNKIQPLTTKNCDETKSILAGSTSEHIKNTAKIPGKPTPNNNNKKVRKVEITHPGLIAILSAGYVTSLPTNDEIKSFVHEGSFTPKTAFSEISLLRGDNDGFEPVTSSAESKSVVCSYASRSSATGASMPVPPSVKKNVHEGKKSEDTVGDKSDNNIPSDDSFSSSSDDDDAKKLLDQVIKSAIPKKKASSRSYPSRSLRSSSRSKDKSFKDSKSSKSKEEDDDALRPRPAERKIINIKQQIANAESKLNGTSIVEYMDNLMKNVDKNDDQLDSPPLVNKSKQVIDNVEKLQPSYSVLKQKRESEKLKDVNTNENTPKLDENSLNMPKTTDLLPFETSHQEHNTAKVNAFLQNGPVTYLVEGTPIEMSRSTSLSNLTVDSGPHENEYTALQKKLRPSVSTSDMEKYSDEKEKREINPAPNSNSYFVPLKAEENVPKHSNEQPSTPDSRKILEDLGKQIDNISISTVEAAITNNYPGYIPSIPHSDEIIKFTAEGSISGVTAFSGLTIDSETKIAPCVPLENNTTEHPKMPMINENVVIDTSIYSQQQSNSVISYSYDNEIGMKDGTYCFNKVEDTPLCFSRNSSLSSLDFDSEDDNELLSACISSAIPPERKQTYPMPKQLVSDVSVRNAENVPTCCATRNLGSYSNGVQSDSHTNSNVLSPNSEEWRILQTDANNVSNNLAMYGNSSIDNNLNIHNMNQSALEALDSDFSVGSSVLDDTEGKKSGPRINPEPRTKSSKVVKGGKKMHRNQIPGKVRDFKSSHHSMKDRRNQDNISSSSSSYNKNLTKHSYTMSGSNNMNGSDDNVNGSVHNCQGNCSQNSMQHHFCRNCRKSNNKENLTSPNRYRRKSANSSCSKQSAGVCDGNIHNHHHNHQRPRNRHNNKNAYRPSVTQIYPPIKDLQQVVLSGVANIAARGETVVAVSTLSKQQNSNKNTNESKMENSSQESKVRLTRQNTFTTEEPSPELLNSLNSEESQNLKSSQSVHSLSPALSRMSVRTTERRSASPKGSMLSVRSQPSSMSTQIKKIKPVKKSQAANSNQSKNKGGKMWKGLKKLLSPSEESKSIDKQTKDKKMSPSKKGEEGKKNKKMLNPNHTTVSKESTDDNIPSKQREKLNKIAAQDVNISDSLSLSSSSDNASANESDSTNYNNKSSLQEKQNLPFGHIPNNTNNSLNSKSKNETSKTSQPSVWRRTPPVIENNRIENIEHKTSNQIQNTPNNIEENSRSMSQMSLASKISTKSIKSDIWVHKNGNSSNHTENFQKPRRQNTFTEENPTFNHTQTIRSESSNANGRLNVVENAYFTSPSRTQSPRVVQVAPFNYKPTHADVRSDVSTEKSPSENSSLHLESDVKQTMV